MQSACFTGHRNLTGDIRSLEERLYNVLEKAIINAGIIEFYAGAALGWDTLSSQVVLKLREVYPYIRLHLILPCSPYEQTAKWSEEQRVEYMRILSAADHVEKTSEHYYNGCMKVRNARLIELADCCFCFWNTKCQYSGTAQTVKMAQKKNIKIINLFKR